MGIKVRWGILVPFIVWREFRELLMVDKRGDVWYGVCRQSFCGILNKKLTDNSVLFVSSIAIYLYPKILSRMLIL